MFEANKYSKVSSKMAEIAGNEKVDLTLSAHESFDLIHIVRLSI